MLWKEVATVERDTNLEDDITWRWTGDGQYSTQSAYLIQFRGRKTKTCFVPIWKAHTEPKCKIFAWILLQHKILTANNLAKRNWSHDPLCQLCHSSPETPTHLCLECPFTQAVWMHLTTQLGRQDLQASSAHSVHGWWRHLHRKFEKKMRPKFDGIMLLLWWNI